MKLLKKTLARPCDVIRSLWKPMSITDLNLLWERCLIRETGKAARKFEVGGWRQQLSRKVHKLFNRVRGRRKRQERDVRAYLRYCGPLVAEETIPELREKGALQGKIEEMLYTPCAATDRPSGSPSSAGRNDTAGGKGIFRRTYSLDSKGKGGRSCGAWRSGLHYRRPVPVHSRPQNIMGRRRYSGLDDS